MRWGRSGTLSGIAAGALTAVLLAVGPGSAVASAPIAVTEPASSLAPETVLLRGHVDPAGGPPIDKCFFEYGATTSYGAIVHCSPDAEPPFTEPTDVGAELFGLQPGIYHYRVGAGNGEAIGYGSDLTFCAGASCPPSPAGGGAPANLEPPAIEGLPRAGRTIRCTEGRWGGDTPQTYTFTWLRDRSKVVSGPKSLTTYKVVAADGGHQLSCRVTATNDAGSASATSQPVGAADECGPPSSPRAVVVMLMGLNSSLGGSAYDPLSVSACSAASSRNPSLHDLGSVFDAPGPGSSGPTLMTSLAQTGAVILPYSYNGAGFAPGSTPQRPRFVVAGYGSHVPNEADVITQDWILDSELESIRNVWPRAKLFVIGHSEGGLIAKQWWRNWDGHHPPAPNHATTAWNAAGVFSLDGPINGGSNALEFLSAFGSGCPGLAQLPCATLAGQFSALWYSFALNGDDTSMARADSGRHGIFTPIGTRGDLVMEVLSMSKKLLNVSGEELGPQLFASFDSDGEINTLINPGRITPTDGSARMGFASHQLVYRDPGNIRFLTQAVERPLAARVAGAPAAGGATVGLFPEARCTLESPAVSPNGPIDIAGSGLGSAVGQVTLVEPSGTAVPLEVEQWSPTSIAARAPAGATEGIVAVETETGRSLIAGPLKVLGQPDGVAGLRVLPGALRAALTRPIKVKLKVLRSDGSAAVGVPVTVSDGLQAATHVSKASGVVRFALRGGGSEFLASSGAAWVRLPLRWVRPPQVRVALHPARSKRGRRAVVAEVHTRGHPVRGMTVVFQVLRRATGRVLRRVSTKTGRSGEAALRVPAHGALVVVATTDFGFAARQISLRP